MSGFDSGQHDQWQYASISGGGIYLTGETTAQVLANRILGNEADDDGGGVLVRSSGVYLANNLIRYNTAGDDGNGIRVAGPSAPRIYNNTLVANHPSSGAGLYIGSGSTPTVTNSIIAEHTVGVHCSSPVSVSFSVLSNTTDFEGSCGDSNNIRADPRLRDEVHLAPDSRAINAGVQVGVDDDIDGEPRPAGAGYDVGADEFPAALSVDKRAGLDSVPTGATLTYTLYVTNTGHVTLTATMTDTLPNHVTPTGIVTWTTAITAPGGVWTETAVVTVEMDYTGPLTNLVQVTTDEGAVGAYTRTVTVIPVVAFNSANYGVDEDAGHATITVTLSEAAAFTATVDYTTSDGSATAGDDYSTVSGTLAFAPGTTAMTFTVSITNDGVCENDETVTLTLSDPVSATLGTSSATLTIADNDTQPTVAFSSAAYSVDEDTGPAVVTVTLSGDTALTATVDYATDGSTATAGDDYTAASGTLTFAPGITAQTFTVPITNDGVYENDETVLLTLSDPVNATLGTSSATLTIADDEHGIYLPLVARNHPRVVSVTGVICRVDGLDLIGCKVGLPQRPGDAPCALLELSLPPFCRTAARSSAGWRSDRAASILASGRSR